MIRAGQAFGWLVCLKHSREQEYQCGSAASAAHMGRLVAVLAVSWAVAEGPRDKGSVLFCSK